MGDICDHLEKTLSGNKNAFREVVAAYSDMAMALAMRRLGSQALAQEAVQEAFFAAYQNLPSLRDAASFSAWFRTILERCCSKTLCKESKALPHACESDLQDPDALDPFDLYTRYLDIIRIRKILGGLSGACREACVLLNGPTE
jgi:RNA polymerase sigma factor (sigma-70 family)